MEPECASGSVKCEIKDPLDMCVHKRVTLICSAL